MLYVLWCVPQWIYLPTYYYCPMSSARIKVIWKTTLYFAFVILALVRKPPSFLTIIRPLYIATKLLCREFQRWTKKLPLTATRFYLCLFILISIFSWIPNLLLKCGKCSALLRIIIKWTYKNILFSYTWIEVIFSCTIIKILF